MAETALQVSRRVVIDSQTFGLRRVAVSGKYYSEIYSGRERIGRVPWSSRRQKNVLLVGIKVREKQGRPLPEIPGWFEARPERAAVYRSVMTVYYKEPKSGQSAEYRVWVHTAEKGITEQDLLNKWYELLNMFPTAMRLDAEADAATELNREIGLDEVRPGDAELGEWFGYAVFRDRDDRKRAEYYARGTAALQKSSPFAVI